MSQPSMKYYITTCEVWVRPLFGKSRLKNLTETWAAHDIEQLYAILREHYRRKRWKLVNYREIETLGGFDVT